MITPVESKHILSSTLYQHSAEANGFICGKVGLEAQQAIFNDQLMSHNTLTSQLLQHAANKT